MHLLVHLNNFRLEAMTCFISVTARAHVVQPCAEKRTKCLGAQLSLSSGMLQVHTCCSPSQTQHTEATFQAAAAQLQT